MINKKSIWDEAGHAGLVLGGVSIAYTLVTWLVGKYCTAGVALVLSGVGVTLLWIVKFVACISLMKLFIKKFAAANEEADNSDTFRFGTATALLSALLYSAFYLAFVLFIAPDTFDATLDILRDSPMLDSNSVEMLDSMAAKLPTMSFFVNLIWCWFFGTVLSAIFSRNIPPRNPFSNIDQQ